MSGPSPTPSYRTGGCRRRSSSSLSWVASTGLGAIEDVWSYHHMRRLLILFGNVGRQRIERQWPAGPLRRAGGAQALDAPRGFDHRDDPQERTATRRATTRGAG